MSQKTIGIRTLIGIVSIASLSTAVTVAAMYFQSDIGLEYFYALMAALAAGLVGKSTYETKVRNGGA